MSWWRSKNSGAKDVGCDGGDCAWNPNEEEKKQHESHGICSSHSKQMLANHKLHKYEEAFNESHPANSLGAEKKSSGWRMY
jgi:hypothetical protein